MKVFDKVNLFQNYLKSIRSDKTIGLVPTMGALHQGHLSLIKQAKLENHLVVVTIFVNPTQFNNTEDLKNYPKTLEADLKLLESQQCDLVLAPSILEVYPEGEISESFLFEGLDLEMEGKFRPGHFNGVGTIVKRLFDIVNPDNAYFGEKDYQQLLIIKKMVKQLQIKTNIVSCPIYREPNGLAMSSRNKLLTKTQRQEAAIIYKTLQIVKSDFKKEPLEKLIKYVDEVFKNQSHFTLEYFTISDTETLQPANQILPSVSYRAFIAVFADSVRLIDNIAL